VGLLRESLTFGKSTVAKRSRAGDAEKLNNVALARTLLRFAATIPEKLNNVAVDRTLLRFCRYDRAGSDPSI
jgi:hypothetical protein